MGQIMYKSILKKGNTPKLRYNEHVRILLFTISRNSLYRDFLIVKGADICSLYHEIHYIEIRYIEVWVYDKFLSISLDHFIKHKPLISEVCLT